MVGCGHEETIQEAFKRQKYHDFTPDATMVLTRLWSRSRYDGIILIACP